MRMRVLVCNVLFVCLCASALDAAAHGMRIFATAGGTTVNGEVAYSDGKPARHVAIEVLGPDDSALGTTRTNNLGEFIFRAKYRCDHTFVAEADDGHRAEFTVDGAELASQLPAFPGTGTHEPVEMTTPDVSQAETPAPNEAEFTYTEMELRTIVEDVVEQEIRPLRKELDAYQHSVRMHDVIGGIGYIVGVMGLVALIKRRPRGNKTE